MRASSSISLKLATSGAYRCARRGVARQHVAHGRIGHALSAANNAGCQLVFHDFARRRQSPSARTSPGGRRSDSGCKCRWKGPAAAWARRGRGNRQSCRAGGLRGRGPYRAARNAPHPQCGPAAGNYRRRSALHVHGVVKVLGGLAVDGDDGQRAEIAPALRVRLRNVLRRGVGLRQHLQRESGAGRWNLRMMISTSTPNSSRRPRISITRPRGRHAGPRKFGQLHIDDHAGQLAGVWLLSCALLRGLPSDSPPNCRWRARSAGGHSWPGGMRISCRMRRFEGNHIIGTGSRRGTRPPRSSARVRPPAERALRRECWVLAWREDGRASRAASGPPAPPRGPRAAPGPWRPAG